MTDREDPSVTDRSSTPSEAVSQVARELQAAIAAHASTLRSVAMALSDLAEAAQQALTGLQQANAQGVDQQTLAEAARDMATDMMGESAAQAAQEMAEEYSKRYKIRPNRITLPGLPGQRPVSVKFETGVTLLQAGWMTWAYPERKRALDALPPDEVRPW